jgi:hypothetical protein
MKPDAVAAFWLPQAEKARAVAARARAFIGDNPDTDAAISAIQEAAAHKDEPTRQRNASVHARCLLELEQRGSRGFLELLTNLGFRFAALEPAP